MDNSAIWYSVEYSTPCHIVGMGIIDHIEKIQMVHVIIVTLMITVGSPIYYGAKTILKLGFRLFMHTCPMVYVFHSPYFFHLELSLTSRNLDIAITILLPLESRPPRPADFPT
jgi:hypothetical protein